jgi:hypothetical protein
MGFQARTRFTVIHPFTVALVRTHPQPLESETLNVNAMTMILLNFHLRLARRLLHLKGHIQSLAIHKAN